MLEFNRSLETIWRYFTPDLCPNLGYAFCDVCNERCKATGPQNVHLATHLKRKHRELWEEFANFKWEKSNQVQSTGVKMGSKKLLQRTTASGLRTGKNLFIH